MSGQNGRSLSARRYSCENCPLRPLHLADTLGLSLVHTNKMIRKLIDRKLIFWRDGGCEVVDNERLKELARWEGLSEGRRPLI
jgi:hypothetical protein